MSTQTTAGPKLCPNCNRGTKYNTTGQGPARYCVHCGWGMEKIRGSRVLKEAKHAPISKEIALVCQVLTPIVLLVPYVLILYFVKPPIVTFTLQYYGVAVLLTVAGFFINPDTIREKFSADDFRGYWGADLLQLAVLLYIALLPGVIVATAIRSILLPLRKNK